MSVACASAASVSALFVRSGPQPALARCWLVSCSTCASALPLLGAGALVLGLVVGVELCVGVGLGLGDRVPVRLGAVVERLGVAVGVLDDVFDGVALRVLEGVAVGVTGVLSSSVGVGEESSVVTVSGSSWLVGLVVSRVTYQPAPVSSASTARAPRIGAITPLRRFRLLPCRPTG